MGHCYQAPLAQPYSVLALSNTTATRHILDRLHTKFMKIYKQKVFLHHYEKFIGDKADTMARFEGALNNCESVIEDYENMELRGTAELTTEQIDEARLKPVL